MSPTDNGTATQTGSKKQAMDHFVTFPFNMRGYSTKPSS